MINRDTILELNEIAGKISISIYMSTNRSEPEAGQDSLRFKNILKDLRNELSEKGVDDNNIDELLSEADSLLNESEFWRYNDEGLALFITEDFLDIIACLLKRMREY